MPIYTANWVVTTGQNIGSLTDLSAQGRVTFSRPEVVRSVVATFSGGTGVADLSLYRHARLEGSWGARELYIEAGCGTDSVQPTRIVIPPGDPREAFYRMDHLHDFVVLWANPDGANMKWVLEIETELL